MSSSLQSFVESGGECGTANPVVELARHFTATTSAATLDEAILAPGAHLNHNHDSQRSANGRVAGSAAGSQAMSHEPGAASSSSFNMEALLEQMKQMDSLINCNDAPQLRIDPLIGNAPPDVEEQFWSEVSHFSDLDSAANKATSTAATNNNNWADEYFGEFAARATPHNNASLHEIDEFLEEKLKEDYEEPDHSFYRSQTIPDLEPFFGHSILNERSFLAPSSATSDSYFKSLELDESSSSASAIANDALNLKAQFSDQEQRLMNMLLSSTIDTDGALEDEDDDVDVDDDRNISALTNDEIDKLLNPIASENDQISSDLAQESVVAANQSNATTTFTSSQAIEMGASGETEAAAAAESTALSGNMEKYFNENQFDDMKFWMKLAEDWESNQTEQTDDSVLSVPPQNRPIRLIEPIDELLDPDHEFYYRFAQGNPFEEEEEEAAEREEDAQKNLPKRDYIAQGLSRLELGDIAAAVLLFEAAAKSDPNSSDAWRLLGVAHAKNENDRQAIGALKRCLALEPEHLEALMLVAICFTNESKAGEACAALQRWLSVNPKYADIRADSIFGADRETAPTAEPYQGPTPLSKRWASTTTPASTISSNVFSNGQFAAVRQCFIDAAAMAPDSPDADVQCGLGVLFSLSGQYDKAADCFRSAVSVRSSDHTLWNRLGATFANGGRSAEAMSAYREALIRYPGYVRARYNLAISCIMLGASREAAEHLLSVLRQQSAGSRWITSQPENSADSTLQELLSRDHSPVTSSSVWQTLRAVLFNLDRSDLIEAVDKRDLSRLCHEFEQSPPSPREMITQSDE